MQSSNNKRILRSFNGLGAAIPIPVHDKGLVWHAILYLWCDILFLLRNEVWLCSIDWSNCIRVTAAVTAYSSMFWRSCFRDIQPAKTYSGHPNRFSLDEPFPDCSNFRKSWVKLSCLIVSWVLEVLDQFESYWINTFCRSSFCKRF